MCQKKVYKKNKRGLNHTVMKMLLVLIIIYIFRKAHGKEV